MGKYNSIKLKNGDYSFKAKIWNLKLNTFKEKSIL